MTIGSSAVPDEFKVRNARSNELQLLLTGLDVAPNGDIYVADGYASDYIHRFDQAPASTSRRSAARRRRTASTRCTSSRSTRASSRRASSRSTAPTTASCTCRSTGEFLGVVASDLLLPAAITLNGDHVVVGELTRPRDRARQGRQGGRADRRQHRARASAPISCQARAVAAGLRARRRTASPSTRRAICSCRNSTSSAACTGSIGSSGRSRPSMMSLGIVASLPRRPPPPPPRRASRCNRCPRRRSAVTARVDCRPGRSSRLGAARAAARGRPRAAGRDARAAHAAAPPPLPAHCRVKLVLKPTADSKINAELWLPTDELERPVHGGGQRRVRRVDPGLRRDADRAAARLRDGRQRHRATTKPPKARRHVRAGPPREDRGLRLPRRARDDRDVEEADRPLLRQRAAVLLLQGLLHRRPPGRDGGAALSRGLRRHHRRRARQPPHPDAHGRRRAQHRAGAPSRSRHPAGQGGDGDARRCWTPATR